jgi:hypothetical protein
MSKIEKITKQLQHEQADAAWITTPLNACSCCNCLVIFSILLIQSSPLSIYVNFTSNQLRIQNYFDAAWITTPLNVFYFTGYRSEPHERLFALLITANGDQTLYCPKMDSVSR